MTARYDSDPSRTGAVSAKGSLKLSIILSTYNERPNLPRLIDEIQGLALPPREILVVDDGSTDGTREYLLALAQSDPSVRVILHDGKQTLTPAQCQGIDAALGEYIIIMDADLQHPPSLLPRMLEDLEAGDDLVVATRYAGGGSPGARPMARGLISRIASIAAKGLVPAARRVSDPVSGYFGFRRDVFSGLNPRYRGYKLVLFVLEMCRDLPVGEIPYQFRERTKGQSKITQDLGFVRIFLVEALLARRDGERLPAAVSRARRPSGGVDGAGAFANGVRFSAPKATPVPLRLAPELARPAEVTFETAGAPELRR